MIDYLSDEKDIIIYAHNGGKFDFHYLLPYLDEKLLIINGRIAKATLFDGRVELRDSMLILPMALSRFKKDEIDYAWFERPVRERHKKDILRYLRSDCLYLHEWIMRFIDQFGVNLTLAGTAFKELKKTSYRVEKTYDDYDKTFRDFYFGGRVQCFAVGAFYGDYVYIDINSAYSDAMMRAHWYGGRYIEGSTLPEGENGSWFAEISAISRGALPYRGIDNKLYFPDDNSVRTYKASGWEIKAGLETGTLDIHTVHITYEPVLTQNFSEYVERFFAMKKAAEDAGDATARQFAKFMLNGCYGKFGQDGRKFEEFAIVDFGQVPEGEGWLPYEDTITGQRIYSRPDPQYTFYNVATAASVTGYVRAHLWRAICDSENPLYCDTDSLICSAFNGTIGKALGEWDIEAEPKEVYIAQRKMYGMRMANYSAFGPVDETKKASKGVRLSFDEIRRGVLTGENITQLREGPNFGLKRYPSSVSSASGKFAARFMSRETDFSNSQKSLITCPPTEDELIEQLNVGHLL